ncbi:hypothetical protein [Paenibacillus brevis]|nr:hypothetical protein [Paenibacillus brevis]
MNGPGVSMISWGHHLFKLASTFDILVKKIGGSIRSKKVQE